MAFNRTTKPQLPLFFSKIQPPKKHFSDRMFKVLIPPCFQVPKTEDRDKLLKMQNEKEPFLKAFEGEPKEYRENWNTPTENNAPKPK